MKLYVKNMVCTRCILAVEQVLNTLEIAYSEVTLGELTLIDKLSTLKRNQLERAFEEIGFAIIDDKKSRTIEQIKRLIIDLVQTKNGALKNKLSVYLSDLLHTDYTLLSQLFSEVEGRTIENYFIAQKIERVKELIVYDELTISEIAYLLNYSNPAHLSNQFKSVTGLSPSHFKKIR